MKNYLEELTMREKLDRFVSLFKDLEYDYDRMSTSGQVVYETMKPLLESFYKDLKQFANEIVEEGDYELTKIGLKLGLIEPIEEVKKEPGKHELKCPTCGGWIATEYIDEEGLVIRKPCSSDYVADDKPCRVCQEKEEIENEIY